MKCSINGSKDQYLKAIIFDMDGVLVDSMPCHAEAWKRAFSTVGIDIRRKAIYELEGSNHKQVVDIIFNRSGRIASEDDMETLSKIKDDIFDQIEHVTPFEGMKELLSSLKTSYALAVVSGSTRMTVHNIINKFFPDTFEVIIDGDDNIESKPSPEPYLKAVEKLGISKEKCLVVENAPMGIASAKSAGLRCIAIPAYLGKEFMKGADAIAKSHKELEELIIELS